jgi:hypothetical protein
LAGSFLMRRMVDQIVGEDAESDASLGPIIVCVSAAVKPARPFPISHQPAHLQRLSYKGMTGLRRAMRIDVGPIVTD